MASNEELEARIEVLEDQIAFLMQHLGVRYTGISADALGDVRNAVREDNIFQAIRLYRDATGAGLKEAKEAITQMQHELGLR